jgi:16S rRNA processing protein RimM
MSTSTSNSSTTDIVNVPPSEDATPGLLIVGRIGKPHGVRGEVYVDLLTDRTERLDPGMTLRCRDQWITVARSRPVSGRWLVTFEGVADREAAARLTSIEVLAPPLEDDPDALWVHQLIGAEVIEVDGTIRGRCRSVIDNPADDILELDTGALVPVTFVVSVDNGVITIDPPDGLFELLAPED